MHYMEVNNHETHNETMRVEGTVGLAQPVVSGYWITHCNTDINHMDSQIFRIHLDLVRKLNKLITLLIMIYLYLDINY